MPPHHSVHAPGGADLVAWVLVVLVVLVPAAAYLRAVRTRRSAGRGWPRWRTAAVVTGLVLVAVALSPPLHAAAGHDPRAHMVQHLLLGMFAPLALVLAAPATLLLGAVPVARRARVRTLLRSRAVHGLTHPATAAVLDMGGLYLLHLTPLHTLAATNGVVHHLVNLHFLLAGYLFIWSIAGPDPAPRRPTVAVRAVVLVVAGAAHAHLAKLLYARAPDLDQVRAAAQLMYYGGDVAELALAVALFAGWYAQAARRRRTEDRAPNRPAGVRPHGRL